MKTDIKKITLAAAAALIAVMASAQNLDPTVEVNRTYEGKLLEVHKPGLEMVVPDSIKVFDLDFDYSVFENPYKGSYDFTPYQLMMKPLAADRDFKSFWLKAGAGYSLYPELGLVWTPGFKGKFKMNVYADYNGYFGQYRSFRPHMPDNGRIWLRRWQNVDRKSSFWSGWRMSSRAGVDGRIDLKKNVIKFDLAYMGIASKDTLVRRAYDAFDMSVNVASRPSVGDYFMYDISAGYRFGEDKGKYEFSDDYLSENLFRFDASMGPVISGLHKVLFDVGFDVYAYSGKLDAVATELSITPHYVFNRDRWNIDLGLTVSKIICPEESVHYTGHEQVVFPDINVTYAAIPDAMSVYGRIGGGNRMNFYSDLLQRNPFLKTDVGPDGLLLHNSMERISVVFGADGRISRRFTYDVKAGFANHGNALMDGVRYVGVPEGGVRCEHFYGYDSYSKLYIGADWNWHAESISFDGSVEYAHHYGNKVAGLFLPASLTGFAAFEYNWNRRLFVGADCRFASARKGTVASSASDEIVYDAVVPGFADLGLTAEYAPNRKLSFWLRGGNLLNATVQYTPLYAEKGINFTAGICLKL